MDLYCDISTNWNDSAVPWEKFYYNVKPIVKKSSKENRYV